MELAPLAKQRFFDANGLPLAGGKLYSYEAGTSTPKTTYSDRAGTANTNPIILDANGYADLWIDSGYYKFILKDSLDNTIWTKDQISLPSEAALASAFWRDVVYVTSADSPLTLTQGHNGKLLSVDCSGGAVIVNLPQISLVTLPYNIGFKLTNSTNSLTINRSGTDTIEGATAKVINTTNASCQLIADIDKSPDQWALLDFGVVDFSGYPSVTPLAEDYVLIVDTSAASVNKKASFKDFKNAGYRSVTTTDSVGVDDEVMLLSGASFTSTLPTAVGVTGKRYTFVHGGTSLTQVYTLATASAQTIGGVASGSYALYTNGETLTLISDGANWQIIHHKTATAWTNFASVAAGTLITCQTANPTYGQSGSPTQNIARWRRDADTMFIEWSYHQTNATGGANGTGGLLFNLPTGVAINTTMTGTTAATATNVNSFVGLTNMWASATSGHLYQTVVYSTTQLALMATLGVSNSNTTTVSGTGYVAPNFGLGQMSYHLRAEHPITGWQP